MNLAQYALKTGTTPAAFRRTLEEFGLKVSHQAVMLWFQGERQPRPDCLGVIEAATGGKVTRYHQRPEIFGKAPKRGKAA